MTRRKPPAGAGPDSPAGARPQPLTGAGPQPLTGAGKTALGPARVRAWESSRPDRLFNDPYAAAFIDAFTGAFPDAIPGDQEVRDRLRRTGSLGAALAFHAVIRTRFYDDYLVSACASGCRQIVLLAAGLDTRAYRLQWPEGVRLFEVDLAEVLSFKESVLGGLGAAARCARTVVAADVRTEWAAELVSAGFSPEEPTAWLAEGLLIYLTADEAAHLLTDASELSADGSRLSCERGHHRDLPDSRASVTPTMAEFTSLWKGGLGRDAADWLASHGWRTQIHHLAALAASYGRPITREAASGFVTATYRNGR